VGPVPKQLARLSPLPSGTLGTDPAAAGQEVSAKSTTQAGMLDMLRALQRPCIGRGRSPGLRFDKQLAVIDLDPEKPSHAAVWVYQSGDRSFEILA